MNGLPRKRSHDGASKQPRGSSASAVEPLGDKLRCKPARWLSHGAPCTDRAPIDTGDLLRRGLERQQEEFRATEPLDSIVRQLDELAREVNQRQNGVTDAEIAAFKHRLTSLTREIEIRAERKVPDDNGSIRRQSGPMSCEIGEYRPSEPVPKDVNMHGQLEPQTRHRDDCSDFDDVRQRGGSLAKPTDQCRRAEAESDLAVILNSVAPQPRPKPRDQEPEIILSESGGTDSSKRDQFFAVVSDRWFARLDHEREQATAPADHSTKPGVDRAMPSILPVHIEGAVNKRPSRSTIAPIVRAGLAAVLAIAVVVTGAHFARSQMSGASAARPITAILHKSAPTGEAIASGPLTIMPANSAARFRDLVFQLPHLYGIYAINSGRLFELEALPGQVPDPRVAVSAAIPRPSHTTLPDGRVAFLLFRRDMATSISERVPIRVVARIRRAMIDPPGAQRTAGPEDTWTIRNIAVDFRVAPVEHNKEMVLLVPENSDFSFPAGRYALILKGQAYDFTIAGPINDPAQCLERFEAANGSSFHECQRPQAGTADLSSQDAPPLASRSSSKLRRQGEMYARTNDQPAKPRTSR